MTRASAGARPKGIACRNFAPQASRGSQANTPVPLVYYGCLCVLMAIVMARISAELRQQARQPACAKPDCTCYARPHVLRQTARAKPDRAQARVSRTGGASR